MVCAASFTSASVRGLLANLVHAEYALTDVLRVFPAVFEDVPQQAVDERRIGTWPQTHILICMGRGSRETRIDDDHLGAVLLTLEDMQQGHRMRFGRVGADEEHRLAVVHVVVGVGHRAVAPGVGYAGNGGGVANARLVIDVIGTPHRSEFPEQVSLLIAEFCRAHPHRAVGTGLLAHGEQLPTDVIERLVPSDALPLAAHQFHRVFQSLFAMTVLAQRSALGTVRAPVER
jgi:hypothetical protein